MTMMTELPFYRPRHSLSRLMVETLKRQVESIRRRMRLRRDRRHLREMPDRMLRDIGISRYEIDAVTEYGISDPTRRRRG